MIRPVVAIGLCLALGSFARPAAAEAPDALLELVPVDPLVAAYVPSVDRLERDLRALARHFDPERAETIEVLDWIPENFGDLSAIVDRSRPAAGVLRLMPGMPQPLFSMVVPVRPGADAAAIEAAVGAPPLAVRDGYAVLGTDPNYAPGGVRPDLLAGVGEQDLTVRVDLEGVFVALGPMLDMLVQIALTQPQGEGAEPVMSQEAATAVLEMLAVLRDGMSTLELSADVGGESVEIGGSVAFHAGGPLALGPQGSLDDVWADAAHLPADASFALASAIDLTNLLPLLDGVMQIMNATAGDDPGFEPMRALIRAQATSSELMRSSYRPYVAGGDLTDDGLRVRAITREGDPRLLQQEWIAVLDAMDGLGVDAEWSPARTMYGLDVRRGALTLDPDAGDLDPDDSDAQAAVDMMQRWLTPVTFAAGADVFAVAMDPDDAAVDGFLSDVSSGNADGAPALLERAREWAGDAALSVSVFDLAAIAPLVITNDAEALARVPAAPIFASSHVDGAWLHGRAEMRAEAAAALWRWFEAANAD